MKKVRSRFVVVILECDSHQFYTYAMPLALCKTIEWRPGTDDNRIHLYATGSDSCGGGGPSGATTSHRRI